MNAPAPAPSKLAGAAAPAILRGETERGHACRPEAELPCRCRHALGLSAPPDLTPERDLACPSGLGRTFSLDTVQEQGFVWSCLSIPAIRCCRDDMLRIRTQVRDARRPRPAGNDDGSGSLLAVGHLVGQTRSDSTLCMHALPLWIIVHASSIVDRT